MLRMIAKQLFALLHALEQQLVHQLHAVACQGAPRRLSVVDQSQLPGISTAPGQMSANATATAQSAMEQQRQGHGN